MSVTSHGDARPAPIDSLDSSSTVERGPASARPLGTLPCALRRTVRMALDLHGGLATDVERPRDNTYAGWPSSAGFGLFLEISLTVGGHPDASTGYLEDIGAIDEALRRVVLKDAGSIIPGATVCSDAATTGGATTPRRTTPAQLLARLLAEVPPLLGREVLAARVSLTPSLSMTMSITSPEQVLLAQRFEFSASHRLHCRELSEERNRQLFGKCNNLNGHGHNYRLDVAVEARVDACGAVQPDLHHVESIVRTVVIDRLDHRHLNLDLPEFADLNPSVENIARVVHRLLESPIASVGGTLRAVTVWETEKTCCTYPATGLPVGP